ncbi:hypothetical protein RND81_14G188300 [Saponaria officinalis]|uniref:Uncharacterized protein n=1 Tax=Saponaria officinalis TaxID=3572 RepID=A0AAW1GRC7_SAPOF
MSFDNPTLKALSPQKHVTTPLSLRRSPRFPSNLPHSSNLPQSSYLPQKSCPKKAASNRGINAKTRNFSGTTASPLNVDDVSSEYEFTDSEDSDCVSDPDLELNAFDEDHVDERDLFGSIDDNGILKQGEKSLGVGNSVGEGQKMAFHCERDERMKVY